MNRMEAYKRKPSLVDESIGTNMLMRKIQKIMALVLK